MSDLHNPNRYGRIWRAASPERRRRMVMRSAERAGVRVRLFAESPNVPRCFLGALPEYSPPVSDLALAETTRTDPVLVADPLDYPEVLASCSRDAWAVTL